MASAAWVLNLDAEDELRLGDAHTTSKATRARIAALGVRLRSLTGSDAVLVDPSDPTPGCAAGLEGRAWCPTPRALLALEIAGATTPVAPAASVLRRVNHRRFAAELGQTLPGARFVSTLVEARDVIAGEPEGDAWLVKPALGFAGRGHLRVPPGQIDLPTERALAALVDVDGGVQLEPLVRREGDFALHGFIEASGATTFGAATVARVDDRGTWRGTDLAPSDALPSDFRQALEDTATATARALVAAGYVGAFNIDAFGWRDRKNTLKFNARSELNARFSMGWAIGMGMLKG